MSRKVKISYINEAGVKCEAVVTDDIDHSYYSSKKDYTGKYPKKDITVLQMFMGKLKKCKVFRVEQLEA